MTIKEITYSLGQTIQVRSYEPRNFHVSLRAEIADGESVDDAHAALKERAAAMIQKDVRALKAAMADAKSPQKPQQ